MPRDRGRDRPGIERGPGRGLDLSIGNTGNEAKIYLATPRKQAGRQTSRLIRIARDFLAPSRRGGR
jgi:hypothetical protein